MRIRNRGSAKTQALHIAQPQPRPAMGELGRMLQRWTAELQQVFALQVALGAFAGDRCHLLGTVLWESGTATWLDDTRMRGLEAARYDTNPLAVQELRARDADCLRRHGIGSSLVRTSPVGPTSPGSAAPVLPGRF